MQPDLSAPVSPSSKPTLATPPPANNDPMIARNEVAEAYPESDKKTQEVAPAKAPVVHKPPKVKDNNVTSAIVATVVIVLGLAVLAVMAYIKTKK